MGTTKSETLHGNLGRAHLLCQLWRSLRVFLLLRFVGRTQTSKGSLLSLLSLLCLENQMFPRSSSEQGCLRLGPVASAVSPWCHIVKDGKASKHAAYQNVVFRCTVLQHSCNGCSGCQFMSLMSVHIFGCLVVATANVLAASCWISSAAWSFHFEIRLAPLEFFRTASDLFPRSEWSVRFQT